MAADNDGLSVEPDFDSAEARIEMRKRHVQLGLRLQAVAIRALELSAENAEKLLDAGRKLESAAMGCKGRKVGDASRQSKKPN